MLFRASHFRSVVDTVYAIRDQVVRLGGQSREMLRMLEDEVAARWAIVNLFKDSTLLNILFIQEAAGECGQVPPADPAAVATAAAAGQRQQQFHFESQQPRTSPAATSTRVFGVEGELRERRRRREGMNGVLSTT